MQTNKLLALKMTENHSFPITPPLELVKQWRERLFSCLDPAATVAVHELSCLAAQWGADQELEACCEWLKLEGHEYEHKALFAARRPKPPSLKEQAMRVLLECGYTLNGRMELEPEDIDIIHRALEQLDD
jgi:hypothetical protein